jgi:hypothetical protein
LAQGLQRALIIFSLGTLVIASASAQEERPTEKFAGNGKIYSISKLNDRAEYFYLVSRKFHGNQDSTFYSGEIRIEVRYNIGGFENRFSDYTVTCTGDDQLNVNFSTAGASATPADLYGKKESSRPKTLSEKGAYNLYWAVCKNKFQKFS